MDLKAIGLYVSVIGGALGICYGIWRLVVALCSLAHIKAELDLAKSVNGQSEKVVAALKEEIRQLRSEADKFEARLSESKDETGREKAAAREAREKLAEIESGYFPYRGALMRRLPNGNIDRRVYCPKCRAVMVSAHQKFPYRCHGCKTVASFSGDLDWVMKELGG